MYHTATILDMYRDARVRLSTRPWRVDDFDDFAESWLAKYDPDGTGWNGAATGSRRVEVSVPTDDDLRR